jgi:hypothetical protein
MGGELYAGIGIMSLYLPEMNSQGLWRGHGPRQTTRFNTFFADGELSIRVIPVTNSRIFGHEFLPLLTHDLQTKSSKQPSIGLKQSQAPLVGDEWQ